MMFDKCPGHSTRQGVKEMSRGEGGYMSCSVEGYFTEEEVYEEEVSMGLQCVPGSGR